jgi:hypothetical protein
MPRSCITGSYGSSTFSFLRTLYTAFHNGCTNLHSHQQYIKVPVLLHPHQHLLLLLPLHMAILQGEMKSKSCFDLHLFYNQGRWTLHVLLAICTSSFENFLFNSCTHFFIWGLILWGLSFLSSCRNWILVSYQMSSWQRFFSILWAVSWLWWLFPLLCRSSLVWCSLRWFFWPHCQDFKRSLSEYL